MQRQLTRRYLLFFLEAPLFKLVLGVYCSLIYIRKHTINANYNDGNNHLLHTQARPKQILCLKVEDVLGPSPLDVGLPNWKQFFYHIGEIIKRVKTGKVTKCDIIVNEFWKAES